MVAANWPGPVYGDLGVLATDGQRVECHICGRWYRMLGIHVRRTHGMLPDDYKRAFGLRVSVGLDAPIVREERRIRGVPLLTPYQELGRESLARMTTEERRAYARGRKWPLQARNDPANRAQWAEIARRGRKSIQQLRASDPSYQRESARKVSATKGGRVRLTCPVCGTSFMAIPASVKRGHVRTCGNRECVREWCRRRLQQRNWLHTPEAQANCRAAYKLHLESFRPHLRVAARGWRRAAGLELIHSLPAAALEALPDLQRQAIAMFYGLAGESVLTQQEIAGRLGSTRWKIEQALTKGMRLLRNASPANELPTGAGG